MKTTKCSQHPAEQAAWRCRECRRNLCPACAENDWRGNSVFVRCRICGQMADLLMVPKDQRPYWDVLPKLGQAIFFGWGLVQMLFLALFIMLMESVFPLVGNVVAGGVYAGYLFFVINQAADGRLELPDPPDFQTIVDNIIFPFLRLGLVSALLYAPAGIYIWREYGLRILIDQPAMVMSDPLLIVIIAASLLYYPGAVITAAIGCSILQILNPAYVLALIWRIPKHYLITVAVWLVLLFVHYALTFSIAEWFRGFYIPFVQAWAYEFIELIVPVFMGLILGRLIYQNAVKLGYLSEDDLFEPEFPEARPLEKELGPPADSDQADGEVDPVERRLVSQLWLALDSCDDAKALESFRGLIALGAIPELDVEREFILAQLLVDCGEFLEAARAYRRAAEKDPQGPHAPEAMFKAGRLLIEKTDKADTGQRILQHLIKQYPQHELAERAKLLLDEQE
ncbi:MAG: hypothetical protein JRJ19_12535 [Deltaproteobacteria bacterium]|nr:hypothetical protein [Deltaproteobacteria bacterium]